MVQSGNSDLTYTYGVSRRTFLKAVGAAPLARSLSAAAIGARGAAAPAAPATLYNGIRLFEPVAAAAPRRRDDAGDAARPGRSAGRRSRSTSGGSCSSTTSSSKRLAARTFHGPSITRPIRCSGRPPVGTRDKYAERTKTRSNPAAMVFSDGVFYDPATACSRVVHGRLLAEHLLRRLARRHRSGKSRRSMSSPAPTSPSHGYVTRAPYGSTCPIPIRRSVTSWPGGTTRVEGPRVGRRDPLARIRADSGRAGDRSTFFYNPFRKVWVFSLRAVDRHPGVPRRRERRGAGAERERADQARDVRCLGR